MAKSNRWLKKKSRCMYVYLAVIVLLVMTEEPEDAPKLDIYM